MSISGSLAKYRVIKIECALEAFTPDTVDLIKRRVRRIDGSWAVRFAVYEDLYDDDSYCGSVIITTTNETLIECGRK
jgi:hypothetical protein